MAATGVRGRRPTVDLQAVEEFLSLRHIAVVGASADPRKFGNTVYRALRDRSEGVVPVNPTAAVVDGDRAYPSLREVPGPLDGVLVMVSGAAAVEAVEQCAALGIRRVWLFQGIGGPGAVSPDALAACERHGLRVVAGACPFMFLEPVGAGHRLHRRVRRLRGAFAGADRPAATTA